MVLSKVHIGVVFILMDKFYTYMSAFTGTDSLTEHQKHTRKILYVQTISDKIKKGKHYCGKFETKITG